MIIFKYFFIRIVTSFHKIYGFSILFSRIKGVLGEEPDWQRLYEDDPVGYVREKQLWDEQKQKLEAVQAEQQRLQQESFAEQQKLIQQQVEEGQAKLLEVIPEWQNQEVASKEKAEIANYATNVLGYTQAASMSSPLVLRTVVTTPA